MEEAGRVARPDALGWAWSLVNLHALRRLRACHTTRKSSVSLLNDGLESRGLGCTTTAFRFRLIRRPTKGLHFNFMKGRFWQDNDGQNDEESGVRCLPSFCPTSFCPSEIDLTNDAVAAVTTKSKSGIAAARTGRRWNSSLRFQIPAKFDSNFRPTFWLFSGWN